MSQLEDKGKPSRIPHEGEGCQCSSEEEHQLLIDNVNQSSLQDVERYQMRTERNTFALRREILRHQNGSGILPELR